MIAYLQGRVLTITSETAIVEVGGVGYELYCSGGAFRKITVGEIVELYTYLHLFTSERRRHHAFWFCKP